jgi:hypothetical protein
MYECCTYSCPHTKSGTILILLEEAIQAFSTLSHHNFSYLVVDDTSPDGIASVVEEFG